ncbi:LysR family transcriptional regulator [Sphingomonas psychrotolerans]|uniref:LysR family transcriptional regulator n=1 Tax=Sphingomonas psychrotolerans TaxID=1327635 RepID=A0A2K8MLZ6_9SPHN|nr:LysR family transcriptional regulator [Sphingomonas psychrotolerans]ATY34887.1 LysR family transcriptional regulator [Sphingomonas psychrotolerans]
MEIEELRTFVEVADSGGISAAARRLGVSKSIVSRRLMRLEDELGIQLLSRNTRGANLTEAGVTFRDCAAQACSSIDIAKETILPQGELRGRLRIAAPYVYGPTHIAPILAEMARRHPRLQIHTSYNDHFVDLIGEGFDCGIRFGYLEDSNLIVRQVAPLHGKLVASPEYIAKHGSPETPEELASHEALMLRTESWQCMDGQKMVTLRPQGRFKSDNGNALIAAALAGIGIGRLPNEFVDEHIAAGRLVHVMTRFPLPPAGIYVVRPPGQHPARKIRILTEMLIECFGRNYPAGVRFGFDWANDVQFGQTSNSPG